MSEQLNQNIEDLKNSILTFSNSVDDLKESVDKLTAIQNDIFNVDTSHDDIVSLKGKMQLFIDTINNKM
jgi:chaperonin cofactor prefoldin